MYKLCYVCGVIQSPEASQCTACGRDLFKPENSSSSQCTACLSPISPNSEICRVCGFRNVEHDTNASNKPRIPLLTLNYVPGREITEALGAVYGEGDGWFWLVKTRIREARSLAISEIRSRAAALGADAVIDLSISIAGIRGVGGILIWPGQSAVVQVIGTAVKLSPEISD